ncbi:MAG: glutamate 5-kinase [Planctomycetaceae bacterium]
MPDFHRSENVGQAETIVDKIGSSVLTQDGSDRIDLNRMQHFAEQFAALRRAGKKVVVVSSGAVAAGMGRLGLKTRPTDLRHLQAAAATGQSRLIRLYEDSLREFGIHVGQLLLTANDFRSRERYLNATNTIRTLFEYEVIPVVNENDTVSVDEIKFGDNDHLAAMLSSMLPDALLVILSSVDGLHRGSVDQPIVSAVDGWDPELLRFATDEASRFGTGGMKSKLQAVRTAMTSGVNVVLANGSTTGVLSAVLAGESIGTWFRSQERSIPAWKRWIGYTVAPEGRLIVDDGARDAILLKGGSLLAVGIKQVTGEFRQGEAVAVVGSAGQEVARGLSNYSSSELGRIAGRSSDLIAGILGHVPYAEVIHRDNLVVLPESG